MEATRREGIRKGWPTCCIVITASDTSHPDAGLGLAFLGLDFPLQRASRTTSHGRLHFSVGLETELDWLGSCHWLQLWYQSCESMLAGSSLDFSHSKLIVHSALILS